MKTTTAPEELAREACDIAMRAAAAALPDRTRKLDEATLSALVLALRREVKAALPQALADAREALDCRLGQQAELTFGLSMAAAGVAAVREVMG